MIRILLILIAALAVAACGKADEKGVRVVMETSAGAIVLELYPDKAPISANNFLRYIDQGHYAGAHFYRTTRPDNDPMIEVIQGGLWAPFREDGDEDFSAPLPPIAHETTQASGLTHEDGVISMARSEPGSASSEFFITIGDNHELDFGGERNPDGQGFAVFGKIVDGMDAVRAINAATTRGGEGFDGQLLTEPVAIISISRQ